MKTHTIHRMHIEREQYVINVCQGPECREYGGPELLWQLTRNDLHAEAGHCQGLCHFAPIAHIDKYCIAEASMEKIVSKLAA